MTDSLSQRVIIIDLTSPSMITLNENEFSMNRLIVALSDSHNVMNLIKCLLINAFDICTNVIKPEIREI